jgi:hypothetical protein
MMMVKDIVHPHIYLLEQNLPRVLILNKERIRPIFDKCMIITCKMTSREKTLCDLRNMKDAIKMQVMSRGMNYKITNMMYIHT